MRKLIILLVLIGIAASTAAMADPVTDLLTAILGGGSPTQGSGGDGDSGGSGGSQSNGLCSYGC